MRTRSRLDAVYEKAFPIPFDDGSKYVFFGDVHRGDDSLSDEFGRNRHIYTTLNYYYQKTGTMGRLAMGMSFGNSRIWHIRSHCLRF
jgi:hypothetical protein